MSQPIHQDDNLSQLRDLIRRGMPVIIDEGKVRVPKREQELTKPEETQTIQVQPHDWGIHQ